MIKALNLLKIHNHICYNELDRKEEIIMNNYKITSYSESDTVELAQNIESEKFPNNGYLSNR